MKRIAYDEMKRQFARVLESRGFNAGDAESAAEIFAQNSLAGVYSHGLKPYFVSTRSNSASIVS